MSIDELLGLRIQWNNAKKGYESGSVKRNELIEAGKNISIKYINSKKYDDAQDVLKYLSEL